MTYINDNQQMVVAGGQCWSATEKPRALYSSPKRATLLSLQSATTCTLNHRCIGVYFHMRRFDFLVWIFGTSY